MNHDHVFSTNRIQAFSDAVVAIIVTLLVLDLRIPEAVNALSTQQAMDLLVKLAPQFLSFALSFFVICIFWVNHHQFYYAIKRTDRKLLWLNNLLLFWLCFIPFPTSFLGRNPTNMVAVMLYGLVLFLAAASFSVMSHYALFESDLFDEHVAKKERVYLQRRSYLGVLLYGASVVIAPFAIFASLLIFLIVPIIYFTPRRIQFS